MLFGSEHTSELQSLKTAYEILFSDGSSDVCSSDLPEQKALGIFYHGCYESLPDARRELSAYAAAQNLSLSGTVRHTYLEGPPQHKDPANFITQVALVLQ